MANKNGTLAFIDSRNNENVVACRTLRTRMRIQAPHSYFAFLIILKLFRPSHSLWSSEQNSGWKHSSMENSVEQVNDIIPGAMDDSLDGWAFRRSKLMAIERRIMASDTEQ